MQEEILTRYFNLSKFLDLIQFKRLYFSSLYDLRSFCKWEGESPELNRAYSSGLLARIDYFMNFTLPSKHTAPPFNYNNFYSGQKYNTPFKDKEEISKIDYDTIKSDIDKTYKISCWYKGYKENMAMWKMYGNTEGAIRVKTTLNKLKQALKIPQGWESKFEKINYISYSKHENEDKQKPMPTIITSELGSDLPRVFCRPDLYENENEFRVLLFDPLTFSKSSINPDGIYIDIDLEILIESIRFSPHCPKYIKDNIKKIIEMNNLHITIEDSYYI
jgi:hypothetical protein